MNQWRDDGHFLNIAAKVKHTRALGPGLRNAVWFQGCPFHCQGCIAPNWIVQKTADLWDIEALAEDLISDLTITGLTVSGGEPFLQPLGLNRLLEIVSSRRPELTLILFSGYRIDQLLNFPASKKIPETLSRIDLLIDGLYIEALNDNQGLRGSSNQNFIRLSNRLEGLDFVKMARVNEVRLENGTIQISGVPDTALANVLLAQMAKWKVTSYERS